MLRRWEKQLDRRRAATALVRPVEDRHKDQFQALPALLRAGTAHPRSRRNGTRDVVPEVQENTECHPHHLFKRRRGVCLGRRG
jgi:hypothetical protein